MWYKQPDIISFLRGMESFEPSADGATWFAPRTRDVTADRRIEFFAVGVTITSEFSDGQRCETTNIAGSPGLKLLQEAILDHLEKLMGTDWLPQPDDPSQPAPSLPN